MSRLACCMAYSLATQARTVILQVLTFVSFYLATSDSYAIPVEHATQSLPANNINVWFLTIVATLASCVAVFLSPAFGGLSGVYCCRRAAPYRIVVRSILNRERFFSTSWRPHREITSDAVRYVLLLLRICRSYVSPNPLAHLRLQPMLSN